MKNKNKAILSGVLVIAISAGAVTALAVGIPLVRKKKKQSKKI